MERDDDFEVSSCQYCGEYITWNPEEGEEPEICEYCEWDLFDEEDEWSLGDYDD